MSEFTAFDWSATPLGPRDGWSVALCTVYDIMMSAHVAMCATWGPEQTLLYNDAYVPFLGARHPVALGRPMREAWPEIWDEISPLIDRAMAGERVQFANYHLVMTRNGPPEDTWWDFSYSALRDGSKVVGMLNVATEATHHVQSDQRRDRAEAVLRAENLSLAQEIRQGQANNLELTGRNIALENSTQIALAGTRTATLDLERAWRLAQDLMVIAAPDGTLEAVNERWTNLLGWREDELIGTPFTTYTHIDDIAATMEAFEGILKTPLVKPYAYRFLRKDGGYCWIGWTAAFENGKIYAVGRDQTQEREQAEQLIQAQKMEAVGQLTGGLAHDFNNLLAGISGSLELMNTRITQGRLKDVEKYMVAAQGASKRAAALTHRLLAFSRRQTLQPRPTNVNALTRGMLDLVRRTVGPDIEVELVGQSGLWAALVDPSQLENALLNLCINARDAMPGGGRITIETANRWIDRAGAQQRDMPEGQYLSLCVSDTGTGMPPEVIAKAFDPFFTTKPIGEGTGLGLSMIYGFAKQSGGQARIYSEMGEGTMVCLYLPRHRGKADKDEELPETALVPFAQAGETVLIVDDEPTVRMLVADVLADLGYTAIEAADGAGGLRVLQSDARIDLLVTDIGLPGGMNGRQVADAGRAHRPELKVLFITGFAENALLNNGQLEPGMSVLTKPFAVDTLAARVRELIAK